MKTVRLRLPPTPLLYISIGSLFLILIFIWKSFENSRSGRDSIHQQPYGMENYSRYAVERLGIKPLKDQRHLLGSKNKEPVINDITRFRYVIDPSSSCDDGSRIGLDLFILIVSAPENEDKRQVVRQTWLKHLQSNNKSNGTDYAFFVGQTKSKKVQRAIEKESAKYEDIIQVDLKDTYYRLPLKTVAILHWALNFCPNADYVLKVDDDVYVNVDNLLSVVNRMDPTNPPSIYGAEVIVDNLPQRDPAHKHYVSKKLWPWPKYPVRLAGGCYIVAQSAVRPLLAAVQTTPLFPFEDVYLTALCASKAKVHLWSNDNMLMWPGYEDSDSESLDLDPCMIQESIAWHTESNVQMYASQFATELAYSASNSTELDCVDDEVNSEKSTSGSSATHYLGFRRLT